MLWWGTVEGIPSGWHLCNGKMSTPDLRNVFVVGAGDTYDPDDTGGLLAHRHSESGQFHDHHVVSGPDVSAGANFVDTTTPNQVIFLSDFSDGRPVFKSLCYIMKIN